MGQNLYVKVQQGIGDQSQTNFILEYELTEWLRLQTNVLQGSSTQQQLFQPHAGHRRRSALLLQLLRLVIDACESMKSRIANSTKSPVSRELHDSTPIASEATCTRASLKQAPPPRSVSVSGASAVAVAPLRVLRRHSPFGRLTVPGANRGTHVHGAVNLAEIVEDPHQVVVRQAPRPAHRPGCIVSLTSDRGSSPSVELIVRSLAGEMSASG